VHCPLQPGQLGDLRVLAEKPCQRIGEPTPCLAQGGDRQAYTALLTESQRWLERLSLDRMLAQLQEQQTCAIAWVKIEGLSIKEVACAGDTCCHLCYGGSASRRRAAGVKAEVDQMMEFTLKRTAQLIAGLLLLAALSQAVYTALYLAEANVPRQLLWGTEGLLFVLLAAFAGSALAQAGRLHLAWSAIMAAAVLNVVQVGVGLTLFGPFFEAAGEAEALAPAAAAVVAFSFMVYNAAKVLLALAAIVFGADRLVAGSRLLGGASVAVGVIALVSNAASMAAGRDVFGELPLAGGSGVLATVLLAVCLLKLDGRG